MQTVECQNGSFSVTVQLTPNTTNRFDVCLVPGFCGTGGCAHVAIDQVSATLTPSTTATSTPTTTPSSTPTPTPIPCIGNCNNSDSVTIDEIVTLVDIALGTAEPSACPHGVPSGATVDVASIIQAVDNALSGCPASKVCGGIAGLPCGAGEVCDRRDPTCALADLAGLCVPGPQPCPTGGGAVCGCDAVTYANDCTRVSAGATLAHAGACLGVQ